MMLEQWSVSQKFALRTLWTTDKQSVHPLSAVMKAKTGRLDSLMQQQGFPQVVSDNKQLWDWSCRQKSQAALHKISGSCAVLTSFFAVGSCDVSAVLRIVTVRILVVLHCSQWFQKDIGDVVAKTFSDPESEQHNAFERESAHL